MPSKIILGTTVFIMMFLFTGASVNKNGASDNEKPVLPTIIAKENSVPDRGYMPRLINQLAEDEVPNTDPRNFITISEECDDFEEQANEYMKKAEQNDALQEKYKDVSRNYMQMFTECLAKVENNKTYSGFRANAVQKATPCLASANTEGNGAIFVRGSVPTQKVDIRDLLKQGAGTEVMMQVNNKSNMGTSNVTAAPLKRQ